MKQKKIFAIGNKIASIADLRELMDHVGKECHILKPEDLNVKDKMNYMRHVKDYASHIFRIF